MIKKMCPIKQNNEKGCCVDSSQLIDLEPIRLQRA